MRYSSFWKVWYILSTSYLDLGFSTDDELKELCYDALAELFPGFTPKELIQRSKLWKIISQLNICTCKLILVVTPKYTNQYIYIPRWAQVDGDISKLLIDCFEVAMF